MTHPHLQWLPPGGGAEGCDVLTPVTSSQRITASRFSGRTVRRAHTVTLATLCNPFVGTEELATAAASLDKLGNERQLYDFLHRNSVMLPFAYNLTRIEALPRLAQRPTIAHRVRHVRDRKVRMAAFLHRIQDVGMEGGLLLKGLPLAKMYPEDCRDVSDVDILLPAARHAARLIGKLLGPQDVVDSVICYEADSQPRGEVSVRFAPLQVSVCLHFGAVPIVGRSHLAVDVAQHAITTTVGGTEIPVPDGSDAILILCGGVLRHGYCKLRDVLDVAVLLDRYGPSLDWNRMLASAHESRLLAILGAFLDSQWRHGPRPVDGTASSSAGTIEQVDRALTGLRFHLGHRFAPAVSPAFVATHLIRRVGWGYGVRYFAALLGASWQGAWRRQHFDSMVHSRVFSSVNPDVRCVFLPARSAIAVLRGLATSDDSPTHE